MKTLMLFFILLSAVAAFAGDVTKMLIEYTPAIPEYVNEKGVTVPAVPESYTVTSYGLKDKGQPTIAIYKTPQEVQKIRDLESKYSVNPGELRRMIIDFKIDGTPENIDVQKETTKDFVAVKEAPTEKAKTDAVEVIRAQVDPIKDYVPPVEVTPVGDEQVNP